MAHTQATYNILPDGRIVRLPAEDGDRSPPLEMPDFD